MKDDDPRSRNYIKFRLGQETKIIQGMSAKEIIGKVDGIKIIDDNRIDDEDSLFLQALLLYSMEKDDAEIITYVISNVPPYAVGYGYLELFLAYKRDGKYFPLMFKCYHNPKSKYAKTTMLNALRRAFPDILDENDDLFVKKAEKYYDENKDKLSVNIKEYYPIGPPWMPEDPPLFILNNDNDNPVGEHRVRDDGKD
jgi:hypothetical protein